ncbi:MAG: glycerol-3-phosphate acyltransferase [Microcoleaceae cyanobacterium]
MQILISALFLTVCFCLGSLPLTRVIVQTLTSIDLTKVGTGNASVASAFTHAPKPAAITAVLAEIARGIAPVLAAKLLFPEYPVLQLVGLIFLVAGRYFIAKGGGVTNASWGVLVYSPIVALGSGITGLLILIIGKKIFPQQNQQIRQWAARFGCLSGCLWVLLFRQQADFLEFLAAAGLGILLVAINLRQSDDMALQKQPLTSLDERVDTKVCGEKATRLALLKKAGFNIAEGFVLPAKTVGEFYESTLQFPIKYPLIIRSSAVGEDSDNSSAAGQYQTIYPVNNQTELLDAINICHQSYWQSSAVAYRRQREIPDAEMAVLIQPYIFGKVAGVMFTRNPLDGGAKVIIEALPGGAEKVVGGQLTPVHLEIDKNQPLNQLENQDILPPEIIQELVEKAEAIEAFFHGLPQDIEWIWDGEKIWILQSRPITNLRPIWTRTIAAEVIPGAIHPLTWSINRPLTCGVWGEIFTIVLGEKVAKLDFTETATLLGSHAYFNATLLGEIFRMMGLPEQGLEFLLRGQKMGKPPLGKVLPSLPGLWRLIQREIAVDREFERDYHQVFVPALQSLEKNSSQSQSLWELLDQAEQIQEWLKPITYYNILGPIGLAIRRSLFGVSEEWLPNNTAPEIVSLRELQKLAVRLNRATKSDTDIEAEFNQNRELQSEFQQWLESYGYLSEVGTDIAVATWQEKPDNFRDLLLTMARKDGHKKDNFSAQSLNLWQGWRLAKCAKRARTKGKIAEVYGKLLAHLRWTFLAIESYGLETEVFEQKGDIFYLEFEEIRQWIFEEVGWLEERNPTENLTKINPRNPTENLTKINPQKPTENLTKINPQKPTENLTKINPQKPTENLTKINPQKPTENLTKINPQKPTENQIAAQLLKQLISKRHEQLKKDRDRQIPTVVYGNVLPQENQETASSDETASILSGIPASVGCVEGYVKICRNVGVNIAEDENPIIVVPYTDAGWAPLLLKGKAIVAEVGGQLSHGAIIAREYGIPAVMNVSGATTRLQDGQRVRVDGYRGIVELF